MIANKNLAYQPLCIPLFNKDIIGLSLSFELTGDILYGDEEAWLELEGQRYHVLCRNVTFTSLENDTLTMIIFQDARDYITHVNQSSIEISEAPSQLIGNSLTMMNLKQTIKKVAVSHANVLITGKVAQERGRRLCSTYTKCSTCSALCHHKLCGNTRATP